MLPFANLSGDPEWDDVARGLAEEILIDLTRFKELVVFGRDTGFSYDQGADVRRIGRDVGVRYVLRGSLRRSPDSGIRVTGELLDAPTGAMLWAESYDRDLTTADLFAIQDDLAREVATAVAQPYGIIFREDSKRSARRPPEDLAAYDCSLRFYAYRADVAPEAHAAVRACLERAVAREPGYAAGWAMLAVLYLDEDRYLFNRRPDRPALDRALEAAKRAADLGPDDARAQQALMLVHFFRGQPDEGLAAGERALALNPNDTEVMAELGGRLVLMSGQRERGEALLREALARNPGHTGFYHATLAVGLYLDGRYREAAEAIERANQPELPIVHGVAAMIYGQLGRREDARAAGREFMERLPTFVANIGAELRRRNLSPSDQFHMLDGLRKAGVPIPEGALDDDVAKHGKEGRGAPRTRTNINKMSGRHRRVGASDTVLEQSHAELSSLAAGPFHRNRRKDDSHVGST